MKSISRIMNTSIKTVQLDDTLAEVQQLFDIYGFHHLLVVDAGKLVGVVSDRDLLKALSPNVGKVSETSKDKATLQKKVHQVMSRKPVTLGPDDSIYEAVKLFNGFRLSCLPVVNERQVPVGIVSWRDILQALEMSLAKVQQNRERSGP